MSLKISLRRAAKPTLKTWRREKEKDPYDIEFKISLR